MVAIGEMMNDECGMMNEKSWRLSTHHSSFRIHHFLLRRLRRRRRRAGLGRRVVAGVRAVRRLRARAGVSLLLVCGIYALAQSLDLRLGAGDRRFEVRAAAGEQLQLLVDAVALALK